ncbi:MAG: sigma-54 dependent transcriptional regulator [Myxococcota bacterium]|nr:sigma-54 dependent transcriptional regulator [Myxococcota bacterium]
MSVLAKSRYDHLQSTTSPVEAAAADAAKAQILVVDDDPAMQRAVKTILSRQGHQVVVAGSAEDALAVLSEANFDVVMLDVQMTGMSGLELLPILRNERPELHVVMMTAFATVQTAVRAVKEGAHDFLTKPFDSIDHVSNVVRKAVEHKRLTERNRQLEQQLEIRDRYEDMVGRSAPMLEVFELVESVSYSSSSVLIQGESGTGKELVARAIHFRSPRKNKPFVVINCSALTETLLESELFGHAKGAFTGATAHKKGLFEVAHTGTIFLDEIGDIPPSTQVKLLRVLQQGELKRVGSNEIVKVDVRTIAATNVNLQEAMRVGKFREDLFYRLNVITVSLPALRERVDDIPLLAYHMLQRCNAKLGKDITGFSSEVLEIFQGYRWQGNVRELENVVERAVVLCRSETIEARHLPGHLQQNTFIKNGDQTDYSHLPFSVAKKLAVNAFEKRYMTQLLVRNEGNVSQSSRDAALDRSNFRRVLKKHDIDVDELAR